MSLVSAALPPGAVRTSYDTPRGPLAAVLLEPAQPRGTVLLVPGYTGSKEDFGPLLPGLATGGWRAVAVDQRGQNESAGPDDPSAYTVSALAADLLAVLATLPGPVHLLGHSFGGLVSRAAVLADPRAVRSLVLLCSGPAALTGPRTEVMAFARPLLEAGGTAAVADASDAVAPADQDPQVRAFLRARFLASSGAGLLGMGEALLGEPDRVAELAATGLPVLVLQGEYDDAWLPPVQHDMAQRLGAAYGVVPGAMHSPAVEQPDATAAALLAFWNRRVEERSA